MIPRTVHTRLCLTNQQHQWLKDEAERLDVSMAQVVRGLIDEKRGAPNVQASKRKVLHA